MRRQQPARSIGLVNTPPIGPVRAQFEALLMQPLLEPLQTAFGDYGAMATEPFVEMLAKELAEQ